MISLPNPTQRVPRCTASMHTMRKSLQTTLVLLVAVALTGCFEDMVERKTYDGPLQVEFAQYHQPYAPAATNANWISTVVFPHDAPAGATVELPLTLQLIGPHQSSALEIGYVVADERTNATGTTFTTTAVSNTHYSLPQGGRATFDANSSHTTLDVVVSPGNLQPGQNVRLILELTEVGELIPARNYRYYDVVIARAAVPDEDDD